MNAITDADLEQLTTRKTLLERAKDAERERLREERRRKGQEFIDLCHDAADLMRNVLGMTEGEMTQVIFERGSHDKDREKVEFEVERFRFRVRYEAKDIKITNGQGQSETLGQDFIPVYEFRPKRTNNWQKFETLADIARPLGVTLDD